MNDLKMVNDFYLTTLEIAEMMGIDHWQILRKLDGFDAKDKNGKLRHNKGFIEILGDNKIVVTDYFIKSSYQSEQNKKMPCYKVTKLGCEFLANKFTGEKGVLFTAKYVKRYNEMEQSHNISIETNNRIIKLEDEVTSLRNQVAVLQGEPIRNDWYYKNKSTIDFIVNNFKVSYKQLYHQLLERVNFDCNIEQYNKLYKEKYGIYPKYPIDVFNVNDTISGVADRQLSNIQQFNFDNMVSPAPKIEFSELDDYSELFG